MHYQPPVKWLVGLDCKYCGAEYDYHEHTSCEESGCSEEGICRCGVIEDARVKSVDIPYVRRVLEEHRNLSELDRYCLERILAARKIWDPDLWEVNTCGGYYGEEIGSVVLSNTVAAACDNDLRAVLALATSREKVEYILNLEYGYLLPEVEGLEWTVETVDKKNISYQEGHYHRVDRTVVEMYKKATYDLPRGVCLRQGERFRLIDGYHRVAAGEGKFKMVVGDEKSTVR